MAQMNLLPWRAQRRELEKKRLVCLVLVSLMLGFLMVWIANGFFVGRLHHQVTRNQSLQKKCHAVNQQIKEIKVLKGLRKDLLSKVAKMQSLRTDRQLTRHLMDELMTILPFEIYLNKLEKKQAGVTLWGYAPSNTTISLLMKNIEKNAWIRHPLLTEIKKREGVEPLVGNEFIVSFLLKLPKKGMDS